MILLGVACASQVAFTIEAEPEPTLEPIDLIVWA